MRVATRFAIGRDRDTTFTCKLAYWRNLAGVRSRTRVSLALSSFLGEARRHLSLQQAVLLVFRLKNGLATSQLRHDGLR